MVTNVFRWLLSMEEAKEWVIPREPPEIKQCCLQFDLSLVKPILEFNFRTANNCLCGFLATAFMVIFATAIRNNAIILY